MTSVGMKLWKSTNGNSTLDKESIVEPFKALFKNEFKKQQQDISNIVSNNLPSRSKKLEEFHVLKKSIVFAENVLKDKSFKS